MSKATTFPEVLIGPREQARLGFSVDLRSRYQLPESVFFDVVDREGLRHMRYERLALARTGDDIEATLNGDVLISRRTEAGLCAVVRMDDAVAFVETSRGSASLEVASRDRGRLSSHVAALARRLGAGTVDDDDVPVTFWAQSPHGARSARRRIKAPDWAEVEGNYETGTSLELAQLMVSTAPTGGRLILWHGEPGTGKTNALRALARAWSSWCATHFITDPEAFLGAGTSYLLDVLTMEATATNGRVVEWKMVVLEDSGELLTADAHQRTGQALSRLLNITDGLIGQGMQVVVMVTTNEPLRRLHPAIPREGRCWKEVEFLSLRPTQANTWLAAHDCATRVASAATIADLFAVLRGTAPSVRPSFGFGAA